MTMHLQRVQRPVLAYHHTPAAPGGTAHPGLLFLGGFRSDMNGTKALYLEEQCRARGQAYTRFDYSGHGQSEGAFTDQTIGTWKDDVLAVIDEVTGTEPLVLAGSSMGGWLALLAARERSSRIAGIVGIAAAPDFTRGFTSAHLTDAQRRALAETGRIVMASGYDDEPYIFTRALIEDGENHCLLDRHTVYPMPIRLIQGMKDDDVPWQTAPRLKNAIEGDVTVFLREHGTHRLSDPDDLAAIDEQVKILSGFAAE